MTEKERHSYITGFYRDLYKKPRNEHRLNGTIVDFLGDVATHPEVILSKVTEEEKNNLDRPLTITELDFSISKAKK